MRCCRSCREIAIPRALCSAAGKIFYAVGSQHLLPVSESKQPLYTWIIISKGFYTQSSLSCQ